MITRLITLHVQNKSKNIFHHDLAHWACSSSSVVTVIAFQLITFYTETYVYTKVQCLTLINSWTAGKYLTFCCYKSPRWCAKVIRHWLGSPYHSRCLLKLFNLSLWVIHFTAMYSLTFLACKVLVKLVWQTLTDWKSLFMS